MGEKNIEFELTPEEAAIMKGEKGETLQKVIKSIVEYGKMFGATKLAPITNNPHFVMSMGVGILSPLFNLMDELLKANLTVPRPFTVDPRPIDHKNVKSSIIEKIVFKVLYKKQAEYEIQLKKLGIKNENAYSCACYLDEVGNIPKKGDILAWSESSAVVFANSVLGAKTNRNAGGIDFLCNIIGKTPVFDLLTDEGRKAKWLIEVKTSSKPNAQLLGSAIGLKVMEDVPFITGLNQFLGNDLKQDVKDYLKDLGAASASNGAVGLYHIENLTPEAKEKGKKILKESFQTYIIDDKELDRIYKSYPNIWKKVTNKPLKAFIGCPHLSKSQLMNWTDQLTTKLGSSKVKIETIFLTAPDVVTAFKKEKDYYQRLMATGAKLSSICPLMYMTNPLIKDKPFVTNSNKLRTYTSARFFLDSQLLEIIEMGQIKEGK